MKKLLTLLILLTVLFLLPVSISAADENGLTFDTAIPISSTDFDNFLVPNADGTKMYFKFTAPASKTYTIISVSNKRIEGTLYDSNRKVFAENRNEVGDFELTKKLTAGETYYIRVTPASLSEGEIIDYSIQFSYEKTVDEYKIAVYNSHCEIIRYNKSQRIVKIPSALDGLPVTVLRDSAFSGKTSLQQVTIPSCIVSIGKECFSGCTGLDIVNFSEGLESIDSKTFYNCNDLIELTMPSTLRSIGSSCFYGCDLLESVTLNEGLESIGESAFETCTSLKKITVPSTVVSFGNRVFYQCSALHTATFLNSMQTIPYATFWGCDSLFEDQIILPIGVEVICEKSFYGCGNLMTIEFLPTTIHTIETSAFRNCEMLKEIIIPEGVEFIGTNAFQDSGATTLSLPSTVKTIGTLAFEGCTSLIRTELPKSVESLGDKVFYGCSKLRSVKCYSQDMTIGTDCFTAVSSNFNLYLYLNSTAQQYAEKYGIPHIFMDLPEEPEDTFVPEITLGDSEKSENPFAVYENTYSHIQQFNDGYTTVNEDGYSLVLDMTNTVHYTSAASVLGNYAENIVSVCDPDNETITFTRFDGYAFSLNGYLWAGQFSGGKCAVMNTDRKYKLIDAYGRDLLGDAYDDILYDTSPVVLVRRDTTWTTVQLSQPENGAAVYSRNTAPRKAEVLTSDIEIIYPQLSKTGGHILCSDGNAYGILAADNTVLTEFKYDSIREAGDGVFVGYYGDNVDLISSDGTVTGTVSAYYVGDFSEGKLPCFSGENYSYIDLHGKTVLTLSDNITDADAFYEGHAAVYVKDKGYTYINTAGIIETTEVWDYVGRFAEGYALVMTMLASENDIRQRWSIIDETFTTVMTLDAEVYVDINDPHATDFSNGYIRTINHETGLMGFICLDASEHTEKPLDTQLTLIDSSVYTIENSCLKGVKEVTTLEELLSQFTATEGTIHVYDINGTELLDASVPVGTGTTICLMNENITVDSLTVIILGDINGDGMVNETDLEILKSYYAGWIGYTDKIVHPLAADMNNDGILTRRDAMIFARHLAGWGRYTLPYSGE